MVVVAVAVIEEWPNIKQTYNQVRAARRRRQMLSVQSHSYGLPVEEQEPMMASGIHEPVQEMTMRSRNAVLPTG